MSRTLIPSLQVRNRLVALAACSLLLLQAPATDALEIYSFTNPEPDNGTDFGSANFFADASPFFVDVTATDEGNNIAVYTMNGPSAGNGAGLSIGISNGENGISSTDGGNNMDAPNTEGVHPSISAVNGGNGAKLQNNNVIRFSAWMRQDPSDPVTAVPQIQPVMKIELWKEAKGDFADFEPTDFPRFGDRVWDTDQNAGKPLFNGFNQSLADWVDMNNSGDTSFGNAVSQSLVTDEWRLVETTIVIDDDPLDDNFGWGIGADFFSVDDIEEIRPVIFFGDFDGNNLTDAGSIWIDNVLVEIFADEASVTPNTNPEPMPELTPGDFNDDGVVNAIDYAVWRENLGDADETNINGAGDGMNGVDTADYDLWVANFTGDVAMPGGLSSVAAPEPATASLLTLLLGGALLVRRSRR